MSHLSRMPVLLTWRHSSELIHELCASYVRYAARRYQTWLARVSRESAASASGGPASRLRELYERLPVDSRLRVLVAPETYRRIVRHADVADRDTLSFMLDCVTAQAALLDPPAAEPGRALWTVLGDARIGPAEPATTGSAGSLAVSVVRSPCLAGTITVDAYSPHSYIDASGIIDPETTHSPDEVQGIHFLLGDATIGIDVVSPQAHDLVTSMTRVVVVRKDLAAPQGFGSSSWSAYIGKVGLTNAHLDYVTAARLANALVHEAIHSLLYIIELEESLYIDPEPAVEWTVISPWSGRRLYTPSYLHACFVWFGLWCFWRLARETAAFPASEAEEFLERAGAGFHRGSLLERLQPIRHHLSPNLLATIEVLQAAVIPR